MKNNRKGGSKEGTPRFFTWFYWKFLNRNGDTKSTQIKGWINFPKRRAQYMRSTGKKSISKTNEQLSNIEYKKHNKMLLSLYKFTLLFKAQHPKVDIKNMSTEYTVAPLAKTRSKKFTANLWKRKQSFFFFDRESFFFLKKSVSCVQCPFFLQHAYLSLVRKTALFPITSLTVWARSHFSIWCWTIHQKQATLFSPSTTRWMSATKRQFIFSAR